MNSGVPFNCSSEHTVPSLFTMSIVTSIQCLTPGDQQGKLNGAILIESLLYLFICRNSTKVNLHLSNVQVSVDIFYDNSQINVCLFPFFFHMKLFN